MLPINPQIQSKLNYFYEINKIPNIIFYGRSGTGKRTIVDHFIHKIYQNDREKIKINTMLVNCAHGKGIKFIRDDLKFFAKTNIHQTTVKSPGCRGVLFKTIIMLNADYLTMDAQSALRRCIELFSHNTRFFIIVENKDKLLNPILSRFCEIYVPEHTHPITGQTINLHQYHLENIMDTNPMKENRIQKINEIIQENLNMLGETKILADLSVKMYEHGFSCLDLISWINQSEIISADKRLSVIMCFQKIKSNFRSEKILIFYLLDFLFVRSNTELINIYSI
jgi:DNA polymerase III delta prime subunit